MPPHATNRSRRAFLLGGSEPDSTVARPPWSLPDAFAGACTGCGDCVPACPEAILLIGDDRLPQVDFRRGSGECTFCGACAEVCPEPVFLPVAARETTPPWTLRAAIGESCLTRHGVMCLSCKDACGTGAIHFAYAAERVPQPVLDLERCTGCGACIAPCPAAAIAIQRVDGAEAVAGA